MLRKALPAAALIFLPTSVEPVAANPLAPIWTGAYIGLNAGASLADVNIDSTASFDTTRAGVGGHVGYNLELGNWLVGVEFDAGYMGVSQSFSSAAGNTGLFDMDWQGSLRGRMGLTVGPALVYATAGWAWTGIELGDAGAGGTTAADATVHGVVYGIGAEAFVLPTISLRLEALRFDYGAEELSLGGGLQAMREMKLDDTLIRAGVTLHFR